MQQFSPPAVPAPPASGKPPQFERPGPLVWQLAPLVVEPAHAPLLQVPVAQGHGVPHRPVVPQICTAELLKHCVNPGEQPSASPESPPSLEPEPPLEPLSAVPASTEPESLPPVGPEPLLVLEAPLALSALVPPSAAKGAAPPLLQAGTAQSTSAQAMNPYVRTEIIFGAAKHIRNGWRRRRGRALGMRGGPAGHEVENLVLLTSLSPAYDSNNMGSSQRRRMNRSQGQRSGPSPSNQASSPNRHAIDPIDAVLAQVQPFGDSAYLHEQLHVRYKDRLGRIAEHLPIAGDLVRALERATADSQYRIIGDPVVRYMTHQALHHISNGANDTEALAECAEIFRETLGHLEAGKPGGPLELGEVDARRLGSEPGGGVIWSEEHRDDVFGRRFRRIVHDNFRGEPLCTPSADDLASLGKGTQLLTALLPLCSRSVFTHTHMVVIVPHVGTWKQKASCSEFRISGTIFLNRDMLRSPWWVAEHLLHESLHQKLYDFRHTHSLLTQDVTGETPSPDDAAAVLSIWNVGGADRSKGWDTFRAVAAFHVYVHLAVLCVQAERRKTELVKRFGAPDASFPAVTHRREALQRAHYLARQIKASCGRELGRAGRMFVDWLISVLHAIDPAPPPPESLFLHLLFHRYMVEATLIARNEQLSPELAAQLQKVMGDEAETLRGVLGAIPAAGPDIDRLNQATARRADESAQAAFSRFRSLVARILWNHSPDGYGLRRASSADSTAHPERMIQAMVNQSSDQLIAVLAASS